VSAGLVASVSVDLSHGNLSGGDGRTASAASTCNRRRLRLSFQPPPHPGAITRKPATYKMTPLNLIARTAPLGYA
jgi:hypothetical protein